MTLPIRERILDAVITQMGTIAGVASVETARDSEPQVFPAITIRDDGDRRIDGDALFNRWRMQLVIIAEVDASGGAAGVDPVVALKAAYNSFAASLQSALSADEQWGGLAELTDLGELKVQVLPEASQRTALISQDAEIQFVTRRGNPFAQ